MAITLIDAGIIIAAYLLGSIPFGLVIPKLCGLGDVRKQGSGNIGATNVLRLGNKPIAFLTLLLDIGKGLIAVIIARYLSSELVAVLAGGAAILGHIFPVWLKFKGGKGVATALGVFWIVNPWLGFVSCLAWLISFAVTRLSSVSSLSAMAISPVLMWFIADRFVFYVILAVAVVVIFRHKDNIVRLIKGGEFTV